MRSHSRHSSGFSLVELMVAVTAGLIVSAAVVAFTMASFKSNGEYVQSTRLTQELRNTLDLVTRDLRRAGYDENALQHMSTGTASPFAKLLLTNTCVIYAYDRTGGTQGTVDVGRGEVRGLRVATRTINGRNVGVIEYAESSGTTRPTCAGASPDYTVFPPTCSSSTWCSLSDPSVVDITAFLLTDRRTVVGGAVGERMQVRDIDVDMTGRLTGTTAYTRNVHGSVRVRADCFDPAATGTDPTNFGTCTQTP
jgi:prepilin-type N-terminal cleavage/methylation domain-containing protein